MVDQYVFDVMIVQIGVWCPVETTVSGTENVLVGSEEDGVVIGDEAFRIARGESVVAKFPVEALVAAYHNATARGGVIETVGAEDAPDVTPLWSVHGMPLCFGPVEKKRESNEKE